LHISVIIPAGGSGKRMNTSEKKQFLVLNKKTILEHTLSVFQNHDLINSIIVVSPQDEILKMQNLCKPFYKVIHIVEGGIERQDSVRNGLKKIPDNCDIILVHDAVRPFISSDGINNIIDCLKRNPVAVLASKLKDTIKQATETLFVEKTIDRNTLWAVQTPQGMQAKVFKDIYKRLEQDTFLGTDEAMLAEYYSLPVKIVENSSINFKITSPEDLEYATFLLTR
jgi:2-C-methyl-D-erythritol 4-phosphate cytidylyltransferase